MLCFYSILFFGSFTYVLCRQLYNRLVDLMNVQQQVTTFFHVFDLLSDFPLVKSPYFLFVLCFHLHRHPSLSSSIHPCISKSGFRSFHYCGADACRPRLLGYFQPLFPFLCTLFPPHLFSALVLFWRRSLGCRLFCKGQLRAGLAGFPLNANIAFGAPSHANCPNQGK